MGARKHKYELRQTKDQVWVAFKIRKLEKEMNLENIVSETGMPQKNQEHLSISKNKWICHIKENYKMAEVFLRQVNEDQWMTIKFRNTSMSLKFLII